MSWKASRFNYSGERLEESTEDLKLRHAKIKFNIKAFVHNTVVFAQ